jgi:uncharacterized protein YutD
MDEYRKVMNDVIKNLSIKSICDINCGDAMISKSLDIIGVNYNGIDNNFVMISNLQMTYVNRNITFRYIDPLTQYRYIPKADLYIFKNVLEKWSNYQINEVFHNILAQCKYAIVVNDYRQTKDGQDLYGNGIRPLNARLNPLKRYKPVVLHKFEPSQAMCLIHGRQT